jgi:putative GTP pyrophosphokinase
LTNYESWYNNNEYLHQLLEKTAKDLIRNILNKEAAPYALIESRAKSADKFVEKMKKKNYVEPKEMSDLVGVRIVGFVLSDINTISGIIENKFDVDWDRSSIEQPADKFGYRGKNYVVTLRGHNQS